MVPHLNSCPANGSTKYNKCISSVNTAQFKLRPYSALVRGILQRAESDLEVGLLVCMPCSAQH